MSNLRSSNTIIAAILGLILGCFVLCVVRAGWDSVAALFFALAFAGWALWVDPFRNSEVTREEFDKLRELGLRVQEDLRDTRFKLFGQRRP